MDENLRAAQNSKQVAEARILDALSWFIKGAVQLRVCNDPYAHELAERIDAVIDEAWKTRSTLAGGGNDDQKVDTHRLMVSHALMNAAGHALYAGERTAAENLAWRAMEERGLLHAY